MNKFEQEYLTVPDNEPVKNFLSHALTSKINGDGLQYDMIVKQIKVRDDPDTLWKVLIGLSSFTSKFTQRSDLFHELLSLIFTFDWKCDKKVNIAMINLIGHIVSANVTFLSDAFHLFVKSFLPNLTTTKASEVADAALDDRRLCIHAALKEILQQVPTGQSILFPILASSFPHKRFSRKVQTEYVQQLLVICDYFPLIQSKVLDLIVSRSLEMDVEIVIEDSGDVRIEKGLNDDEEEEDEEQEDLFRLDEEQRVKATPTKAGPGLVVPSSGGKARELAVEAGPRIPKEVSEMADNLDAVLVLLVQYFEREMARSPHHQERLNQQLLTIFESKILLTHKSKFVQFCMFFVAARCEAFASAFARRLLAISLDIKMSNIARQSAVMYLASFVARASFLPNELVNDILSQLIVWASAYVLRTGGNTMILTSAAATAPAPSSHQTEAASSSSSVRKSKSTPILSLLDMAAIQASHETEYDEYGRVQAKQNSLRRHEIFYSVIQCACYVLCFHGCELAASQRMSALLKQHWECVATSKYDPLRYCLKTVRIEFLKLAMHVGLFEDHVWDKFSPDLLHVDAQTLLYTAAMNDAGTTTTRDANSIYSSAARSQVGGGGSDAYYTRLGLGANPLDTFFPFDPCLLAKLYHTIERHYRAWQGVPGLDEEIDSEGEEDGYSSDEADDHLLGTPAIAIHDRSGSEGHSYSMASSMASSLAHTDAVAGSMMSISNSMPGEYFLKALRQHHHRSGSMSSQTGTGLQQQQHHATVARGMPPSFDQWNAGLGGDDELLHEPEEHLLQLSEENLHSRVAVDVIASSSLGKSRRPRQYSIGSNGSW